MGNMGTSLGPSLDCDKISLTNGLSGLDLGFLCSANQRTAEETTQDNRCPDRAANGIYEHMD